MDSKIVGLWSMTFKTAGSEGTVILDCQGNHSLNVTECFTIDNIINAAFVRYSGSWQLNSGKLYLNIQQSTNIKWTAEIAKQFETFAIPAYQTNSVLSIAGNNAPTLTELRFGKIMRVRSITDKELVLSADNHTPIKFHKISAYPKGGRIKVSDPIQSKGSSGTMKSVEVPTLKEIKRAMGAEAVENISVTNFDTIVKEAKSSTTQIVGPVAADSTVVRIVVDDDKIYDEVEQKPQFPGGISAMNKWISDNMSYPQEAINDGVEGRAVIQFVVRKDGSVGKSRIIRGMHKVLNQEATRIVSTFPNFIPGKMEGRPVNVWYTLPITFKLPK